MAKEAGASAATISRIWRSHGLKPHSSKNFKVSNDIRFEEKLTDIVGLCMNPPEQAHTSLDKAKAKARCQVPPVHKLA
jgi:hypothetical protein